MKDCCVSFPCCHPESCIPGLRGEVRLEEPAAGNLHGGVCEGGEFLGGHGEPKRARNWKRWKQPRGAYSLRDLLYSEVDGHQLLDMIFQEGAPSLRRRLATAHHVFAYAGLPDVDAEFEQLAVDARRTPSGILSAQPADQVADFVGKRGSSRPAPPNLPCPEETKALAVPGQDGLGLNNRQRRAPIAPDVGQPGPQ